MRRFGINICGNDVRFDLVAVNAGAGAGMIDRIQEREKFAGLVAVAECGESEDGPDRRMSILNIGPSFRVIERTVSFSLFPRATFESWQFAS